MCVKVLNKARMLACSCMRQKGESDRNIERVCACDLVSLRKSLQSTVMTGGISKATKTRENSLLSFPQPQKTPHLLALSLAH